MSTTGGRITGGRTTVLRATRSFTTFSSAFLLQNAGRPSHRALCDVWVFHHRTISEITGAILLVGPLTAV